MEKASQLINNTGQLAKEGGGIFLSGVCYFGTPCFLLLELVFCDPNALLCGVQYRSTGLLPELYTCMWWVFESLMTVSLCRYQLSE